MNALVQQAWIFANGEMPDPSRLKKLIQPGDRLYAADGGANHLNRLGMLPERVIGDLDSLSSTTISALQDAGVLLERYSIEKDETDLELALHRVMADGNKVIRIACAMGGRFDQSLGNLFLLSSREFAELNIRLEDGLEEIFMIRHQAQLKGAVGDIVSLLPLGGPVKGIITSGLEYPLQYETLYPDRSRGISNRMVSVDANVTIAAGLLICIHTRV